MAERETDIAKDVTGILGLAVVFALLALVFSIAIWVGLVVVPAWLAYRIYAYRQSRPAGLERQARQHLEMLRQQALAFPTLSREDFVRKVFNRLPGSFPPALEAPVRDVVGRIYDDEVFEVPSLPVVANSVEGARFRQRLADRPNAEAAVAAVASALAELGWALPRMVDEAGIRFVIPIRDRADANLVGALIYPLFRDPDVRPLPALCRQLDRNFDATAPKTTAKAVLPEDYKGTDNIADVYLRHTPLLDLFEATVPLVIPTETRFSHTHILGGSGAGKTQLLQHIILQDLMSPERPAIVVVDGHGDLIRTISRLALFDPDTGPLADRLVLISPRDIDHPPAINIFDINHQRLGAYGPAMREQVVAGAIDTFDYLFAGLLGADLTAKQGVFFRYVARLMLTLPETYGRNATILDMLRLMEDAGPYREAIAAMPPIQREFFERDFAATTFRQTKEQIRYRLNAILENPTMARLFTSPETRVDLFTELNRGSVILIDTAKDFLKGASAHFGRLFISLVLQAVMERAALPAGGRHPAFLFVDEAADYFDQNIDELLTEVRKYGLGCAFAHQFLDQATSSLRASLAANTAIKFASGVSVGDARALAPDLRASPDFILGRPKLHFACYARGVTESGVSVAIKAGRMEREERLSDGAYQRLLERNRQRVAAPSSPAQNREAVQPDAEQTATPRSATHRKPRRPSSPPSDSTSAAEW